MSYLPVFLVLGMIVVVSTVLFCQLSPKSKLGQTISISKKNYIVYYLLASIDIVTIGVSLYLNHSIMLIHEDSIRTNIVWAERRDNLVELAGLSTKVNAPGNNVFETLAIQTERNLRDSFHVEFVKQMNAITQNIKSGLVGDLRDLILKNISNIEKSMNNMMAVQNEIFGLLAKNKMQVASSKMAHMDRKYADLTNTINVLNLEISTIQNGILQGQKARADELKFIEYCLAAIILLIVVMVAIYGHILGKQSKKDFDEKLNWYRNLIDSFPAATVNLDKSGVIRYVNKSFEYMFKCKAGDVLGLSINDFFNGVEYKQEKHGDLSKFIIEISDKTKHLTVSMRTHEGELLNVEMGSTIVEMPAERLHQLILTDVSDLDRIAKMKNELIAVFSHEIRTPLTSMRAGIYILMKGKLEESKPVIEMIASNCERLISLTNNMLDIEKIEMGKVYKNIISRNFNKFIDEVVMQNKPYAEKYGIDIKVEHLKEKIKIETDYDKLSQVLANLLSNAIKFSEDNSIIELVCAANTEKVTVSVIDSGHGVPSDFVNQLFEKFSQHDASTTRKNEGAGIGLALSKQIIENLQGRIYYSPNPHGGAMFTTELPIQ